VLPLLLVAATYADEVGDARASYTEGSRLYAMGDYQGALSAFKRSYLVSAAPDLLYNMAQCHRALGEHREALRLYQNYLELVPGSADRAEVERLLAEERAAVATGSNPPPATGAVPVVSTTTAPSHATPERGSRAWVAAVVVVAVVVVAAAVTGVVLGLTLHSPPPMTSAGIQSVMFP
jgi:tetratricopeptide (TPR) repeat protein